MPERRLLLSCRPGEVRGVLLEDDNPVEIRIEREDEPALIGGLFLARILRVAPALPGAFVALGGGTEAFLPGKGLPRDFLDTAKSGAFVEGAAVLAQVVKEPRGGKPAEVTASPRLEGSFLAWTPAQPGLAPPKRLGGSLAGSLGEPLRRRLDALLAPLLAGGEGVALLDWREGLAENLLVEDVERLRARWMALLAQAKTAAAPGRLDPAPDALDRMRRAFDRPMLPLDEVIVDEPAVFPRLKRCFGERAALEGPDAFGAHGVDEIVDAALDRDVILPGGGRLIVEATAAAVLIDVDLGAAGGARGNSATAILHVNLEAARAAAVEIRRRNLAGMILVDFISMSWSEHRREVEAAFRAALAADPLGPELHGWTRLGLMELTRRRTVPSLTERLLAVSRPEKTERTLALEALARLAAGRFAPGPLRLEAHPRILALFEGPLQPAFAEALRRSGRRVATRADEARPASRIDIVEGGLA